MRIGLVFSNIKPSYFPHLELVLDAFQSNGIALAVEQEFHRPLLAQFPQLTDCAVFNDADS
jgi:hypothetical protein